MHKFLPDPNRNDFLEINVLNTSLDYYRLYQPEKIKVVFVNHFSNDYSYA